MDIDFLPKAYKCALEKVDKHKLSELRMRLGFPVSCVYNFKRAYLCDNGITLFSEKGYECTSENIKEVINNVTEFSIYAHNDKIKQGFLTTKSGMRIGLGGECVYEGGKIVTIKNVTSLNIRWAKEIENCSKSIFNYIYSSKGICNSLIISPPAFGKTTILKDVATKLNVITNDSILIIDERGEFVNVNGENLDKISYSDKLYGLTCGIRTLSPSVVITDELSSENDWICAQTAINSGVKIIASCHGKNIDDIKSKKGFVPSLFERYIILDELMLKPGVLKCVYGRDLELL